MNRQEMIDTIEEYYRRLDSKALDALMEMLVDDCHFSIETLMKTYDGRDSEIHDMFARLYETYATVWHGNYRWTVDIETNVVGCQLEVVNTGPDGIGHRNHNSSFFHLRDGLIARVDIYIGGSIPKQLHD